MVGTIETGLERTSSHWSVLSDSCLPNALYDMAREVRLTVTLDFSQARSLFARDIAMVRSIFRKMSKKRITSREN